MGLRDFVLAVVIVAAALSLISIFLGNAYYALSKYNQTANLTTDVFQSLDQFAFFNKIVVFVIVGALLAMAVFVFIREIEWTWR